MLTDRQRKVIKCILNHPKGIYAATIAEQLKVSDRTVRNDIASINMVLMNSQCMIQSSKRTGYFIMQENIARIRECLSLMDAVDGMNDAQLEALKQRIRAAEQARKAQPAFALAAAYAELPDDAIIEL